MTRDQAHSLRQQQREQGRQGSGSRSRARKIAITSGKGGVGKSNVSVNLAIALARLGKKVLLVDADTNLANIDILLGLQVRKTLADVIFGEAYFSEILVQGPENIRILPGSSGVVEMMEEDQAVRNRIFEAFEDLEQAYDVMLIDTGAGLSENVIQFVVGCQDVVLVTNPEPTAITDAYAMVKVATHRNPLLRMHVLINMVKRKELAEETYDKLRLAVRNFLQYELNLIGHLPADPKVADAVEEREPFQIRYPRCPASSAMNMVARRLLSMHVPADDASFVEKVIAYGGNR